MPISRKTEEKVMKEVEEESMTVKEYLVAYKNDHHASLITNVEHNGDNYPIIHQHNIRYIIGGVFPEVSLEDKVYNTPHGYAIESSGYNEVFEEWSNS